MKMEKFDTCKMAHEMYHSLKEKLETGMYDDTYISDREFLMFIASCLLCDQEIMEMTRKNVWNPVNKKIAEADGIHTVYIDDTSHFMHDVKGHDINKAIAHVLKHIDSVKMTDPVKYNALVAEIKA